MSARARKSSRARRSRPDPVRRAAVEILSRWVDGRRHAELLVEDYESGPSGRELQDLPYAQRRRLREIVYGCIRLCARYDHVIAQLQRQSQSPGPRIRALLWMALHEICELRTPAFATVDQAVTLARRLGLGHAAPFVNALLRGVLREGIESYFPLPESDPVAYACTWWSHPRWLVERWVRRLGPVEALELCRANDRRPRTVFRAAPGGRDDLLAQLYGRHLEARSSVWAPDGVELISRIPPRIVLEQMGVVSAVQDEAAQLVAPLCLAADPSRWIVDLCAAPGGKSTHLAELMPSAARLLSIDISQHRLSRLRENLLRRRLQNRVDVLLADGRAAPLRPRSVDAVLLDAPCTGTGVLSRRHDARWRRQPEDLPRMSRLQHALLDAAIDLLRPGGIVVYSTCSLEPEENDEVVDSVLRLRDDVEEIGVPVSVATELRCGKRLQCWPHRHGTDGAFAARLRRKEDEA